MGNKTKNKAMRTYLIQQAAFKKRAGKGIDSILSMDYMGAAEYEFGALPQSLGRIRAALSDYTRFDHTVKDGDGKIVTVFCRAEKATDVSAVIDTLAAKHLQLKCGIDFSGWVKPAERFAYNRNDFWWDIENDFMFWKQDADFAESFSAAIAPDRKAV